MTESCCMPARRGAGAVAPTRATAPAADPAGMALVEAGTFLLGADDRDAVAEDGEGPVREVALPAFLIDRAAVSNDRFAAFADATGYRTDAERFGWSFVFEGLLPRRGRIRRAGEVPDAPWWIGVRGACWRHPEGPDSALAGRHDHPAVHVSWNDAAAYCAWAGKRLPSEDEWEAAARGGLRGRRFPWGDELRQGGEHHCNVWQGRFPLRNTCADGYAGTAPVTAFSPNGYGLHNCSGNVWEWCADWFAAPRAPAAPAGARRGRSKVLKGGSYLCHASYCSRYRVAARYGNTPHTTSGHAGFRCAADP